MKMVPLFWLLFFLPSQVLAQPPDCQIFQSSGEKTLTVDPSYGGYYVIAFGLQGNATGASLSVAGARESADGGADFHLTFSHQDLPAELPTGIVNGLQFELTGTAGKTSEFWVMLGKSPQACRSAATPGLGSTPDDQDPSAYIITVIVAVAIALLFALVAFLFRKRPS